MIVGGQGRLGSGALELSLAWLCRVLDLGLLIFVGRAQHSQIPSGLLLVEFSPRASRLWQLGVCTASLSELHIQGRVWPVSQKGVLLGSWGLAILLVPPPLIPDSQSLLPEGDIMSPA